MGSESNTKGLDMDTSPQLRIPEVSYGCRIMYGAYEDNRERYFAQSKLTKNGDRAELPSLEDAKEINKGHSA